MKWNVEEKLENKPNKRNIKTSIRNIRTHSTLKLN